MGAAVDDAAFDHQLVKSLDFDAFLGLLATADAGAPANRQNPSPRAS